MQLDTKLPKVGTTIFSVMSQLALEHKAVNLGQGFPDFEPPEPLRDAITRAMAEGKNQYAPGVGIPSCVSRSRPRRSVSTVIASVQIPRSRSRPAPPRRFSPPLPPWCGLATR